VHRIDDDDRLLGVDVQDIIVGCLDSLTAEQRHGKTLINLVRLITHDNSAGKGRSDGKPYPLASILGRAIEDYDSRWPGGSSSGQQEQAS
jgi:hypothetical protein